MTCCEKQLTNKISFSDSCLQEERDNILCELLGFDESRLTLNHRIALSLAKKIILEDPKSSLKLNSVTLAHQFGTSRTPIREALLILEKHGLVVIQNNRQVYVKQLGIQEIIDIYTVRDVLIQLIAKLLIETLGTTELSELKHILSNMVKANLSNDGEAYFWANVKFHGRSAAMAQNETLRATQAGLGLQVLRLRHLSMSLPGRRQRSIEEHLLLFRAYEERESLMATTLSHSIIQGALKSLIKYYNEIHE